jgi:iron(III) transport system permease protein
LNLIKDFFIHKSFNLWIFFSLFIAFFLSFPILSLIFNVVLNYNSEWNIVLNIEIWNYLYNSICIIFFQSIFVAFFGVICAWIVTTYDFPFRRIIDLFLLLPLSIPPYVAAIAYGELFDYSSYFQIFFRENVPILSDIDLLNIRSLPGVIFIFSITLYPYVYIISRAAFSEISYTYSEIGKTLGLKQLSIFFKIFLPLAIFPIIGGIILSILESLNDFGTVQYYGVDTFTTGIYKTWVGLGDINMAAQISIFFLFFIFFILFLQKRFLSNEKINLKSSSKKKTNLLSSGKLKNIFLISFCFLPPTLGFFIPFIFLLSSSINALEVLFLKDTIINTFNTVFLALSVSFIIIFLSLLINYSARIKETRINLFFNKISSLGYAIPGSIIAIGILIPFTYFDNFFVNFFKINFNLNINAFFTGSIFILCFAYVVRFFTISQTNIESSFYRISKNIDDTARVLGKKPILILFNIHVPLMSLSILLSLVLIFIEIIKELSATLILRPFNFNTLAIQVYEYASEEKIIESSIPSLIIVVLCVIGIIFMSIISNQLFKSGKT